MLVTRIFFAVFNIAAAIGQRLYLKKGRQAVSSSKVQVIHDQAWTHHICICI
jgi:hypothetical protein